MNYYHKANRIEVKKNKKKTKPVIQQTPQIRAERKSSLDLFQINISLIVENGFKYSGN